MAHTLAALRDFLQEQRIVRRYSGLPSVQARQLLAKSQLLKTMQDICASINREAGTLVVEELQFLPPEPIVSSFTFRKDRREYVMQLELWGSKPYLAFITRKWRDARTNPLSRFLYWLVQPSPLNVNLKLTCELQEEAHSEEAIKQCFYYLLSGFSRSYIPPFRSCKNSSDGGGWG